MKKLMQQLVKFGLVGAICFVIDFAITVGLKMVGVHYLVAGFFGFVISVIANYVLSFKFVFERKENLNRKAEFVIFVVLSVIGLGINELIMYLCMDCFYYKTRWAEELVGENVAVMGAKIAATAVVMIYNFVTRKIFLEKKEEVSKEVEKE